MSLITRCVHCHSVFRITLDQLQAHGGQVRCGRCMQVFNGLAALTPDTPMTEAAAASPAPVIAPDATIHADATVAEQRDEAEPAGAAQSAAAAVDPTAAVDPVALSEPYAKTKLESESESESEPAPAPAELPGPMPRAAAELLAEATMDDDNPFAQEPPVTEPPARIRQPLLFAACVLLMLCLAAQAVYFYRGELAARHPLARHWLDVACARMGCLVQLPQRPQAVLIEASDLQVVDPDRPSRIQLTATLRNHAGYAVGYPALDLVLTNVNDHTLVRRIFLPAEYLGAQRNVRAGIAANAELTVRLALETGNLGAAGFRLAVLSAPLH